MPQVDAAYNHAWATAFATGDWDGGDPGLALAEERKNPHFRPPGYGYFLGGVYTLFGRGPLAPCLIQALLGVLTTGLVGWVVWRLAGRTGTALLSATACAVYRPFLYFETQLLDTSLLVFLFALFLAVLVPAFEPASSCKRRAGFFLAAGAAAGVAAVVRPNILLALPFLALVAAVVVCRRAGTGDGRFAQRALAAAQPGVALALGVLLPILPVTFRNLRAGGGFVLISANAGINLFIGNNPGASGVFSPDLGPWGRYGNNAEYRALYDRISRVTGYPVTYAEASRFLSREAWKWMRKNPAAMLHNMGRKALLLIAPHEAPLNGEVDAALARSGVLRRLPLRFDHLLAFALAGLAVFRRGRPDAAFYGSTWLVAVCYAFSFLPFFVAGQYRTPLAVPLLVLAGLALPERGKAFSVSQWRVWAAVAAASLALLSLNPNRFYPKHAAWLETHAKAHHALGEREEELKAYRECLNLARKLPEKERAAERAAIMTAFSALGSDAVRKGNSAAAAACFEEAVHFFPDDPELLSGLASATLMRGNAARAAALFSKALALRPGDPKLAANLRAAQAIAVEKKKTE